MLWKTLPLWKGRTAYILGGGPGLLAVDLERLRGERIVAVNNAFKVAPFSEICYFKDFVWFGWNAEELRLFGGMTVTSCYKFKRSSWIRVLREGHRSPFDTRRGRINRGTNAGFEAACLALKLGARKLVLLGFDMRVVEGKANYHDEHRREVGEHLYSFQYSPQFYIVRDFCDAQGIPVFNATPGSELEHFPIIPIEEIYP